jgi:hypothetical protein
MFRRAQLSVAKARSIEPSSPRSAAGDTETLFDKFAREKAVWLQHVMYRTSASPTERCLAYIMCDHLNCVTRDCWPSLERMRERLGCESCKTVRRAIKGLVIHGVLTTRRDFSGLVRYEPVFLIDRDKNVPAEGQVRPAKRVTDVHESLLGIQPKLSFPTETADEGTEPRLRVSRYDRRHRGSIEVELAGLIGSDGMEILSRLGAVDDAIIERLCRAYARGVIGEREIHAARLAAEQLPSTPHWRSLPRRSGFLERNQGT